MIGPSRAADRIASHYIEQATDAAAPSAAPARVGRHSVRVRLMGIVLVGAVLTMLVGVAGLQGMARVNEARGDDIRVTDVQFALARVDAQREAIGASTLEVVLSQQPASRIDATAARKELTDAVAAMRADFVEAVSQGLAPDLQDALWGQWSQLANLVTRAQTLAAVPAGDANETARELAVFDAASERVEQSAGDVSDRLEVASLAAEGRASRAWRSALVEVVGAAALALVLLVLLAWTLGREIVRGLRGVGTTAVAITGGDLHARTSVVGDDEIGTLGRALNQMAESLGALFTRLGDDARRDSFGTQLSEAFELADTLPDAYAQVEVVMQAIGDEYPMELLLADSSQSHMGERAVHPVAGSPGCPVQTPYECVAVRRGAATVFETSEAMNSCPKLRDRPYGACSAVCVPVTFMGRALGVLHTTGPDGEPPDGEHVVRLTALAAQAGSTIGTVRSTETTVRQATIDGLTGLINRRTLENSMRELFDRGEPFAVAMADLDHFKNINDTYGHEAGDRALRLFSQVVQRHVRADDVVGRYGGEEFVFLFPGQTAVRAVEMLERLRAELASAQSDGSTPRFTASFGVSDSLSGATMDEVLRRADEALGEAKRSGRDRVLLAGAVRAPDPADSPH
jgi:diguanylate cyclase (GGDEF)-like protein